MEFLRFSIKRLLESFKLRKNKVYGVLFQGLLIVAISIVLVLFLTQSLMPNMDSLMDHGQTLQSLQMDPYSADRQDLRELENILDRLKLHITLTAIGIFVLFLVLKSFVWKFIKNIKFNKKYFLKSVLANTAVILFVVIFGVFLNAIVKDFIFPFVFILFLVPLYVHLETILNSSLKKKPWKNLVDYGIKKIHYFILAHAFALVAGIILLLFLSFGMTFVGYFQEAIVGVSINLWRFVVIVFGITFLALVSVYMAWIKNYVWVIFSGLKEANE